MEKFTGIIWQQDKYTKQLMGVLRGIGILGAFVAIIYGGLVWYGLVPSPHFDTTAFVVFSFGLFAMATAQFLDTKPTFFRMSARLMAYHLLIMGYALFVTGFYSLILIGWPILLNISYVYFGRFAFFASTLLLLLTAAGNVILYKDAPPEALILNIVASGIVIFVGSIISWLGRVHAAEHFAFQKARASESLQRDRIISLVNSIGDAILNTDAHGVIRTYNAASLDLFDTNESLNGKKMDDLLVLYNENNEKISLFKEVAGAQTVIIREDLTYRFGDGERMRLSINCSPVLSSFGERRRAQDGYIFILRDITKAKSLEEERDEFISVVSHELRTPITIAEATVSNAQFLLDHKTAKDAMDEALASAHEQILYLAKMVNDLSTLSRAERGVADDAELVDLDELMHSLYHEYHPQASVKKLTLDLDINGKLGTIMVSRLYLEEILQNFITNSLKYTREGGITITAKRTKEGGAYFAVADTGIGVSKSDQKHIFQKFYRSEDYRTRETSGTGLGLYIVKKLAQKLGTEVEFTSRLNHGSTFFFTLPQEPPKKK
ncbi:multi-sensor signal transduction histidine kinase [candidate division TM7 genomosp. GTL1]|nr:multi-sensor signal transduction histidine kinase [candidate division TM7 genomosp. GTL1]